ncbi:MAG: hypothetical protein ACR652_12545 [Methylocystis sp.]|uniref:hypothetical protein n=1 Tax=Methylocystis sp. TaxID=1911079 RepID=UPI003DA3CA3D
MLVKNPPVILALGLVLAASLGAKADICFQYKTGGAPLVAKGAKLPAPNTCVPLAIFEAQEPPGQPQGRLGAANAMLCKDKDITLLFHYDYDACIGPGSYSESATCRLSTQLGDLPSTASTCNGQYFVLMPNQSGPAKQFTDFTLNAWYCDGKDVPIDSAANCRGGLGWKPFSHPELGEGMSHEGSEPRGKGQ